jgi:hypothetical protein
MRDDSNDEIPGQTAALLLEVDETWTNKTQSDSTKTNITETPH